MTKQDALNIASQYEGGYAFYSKFYDTWYVSTPYYLWKD